MIWKEKNVNNDRSSFDNLIRKLIIQFRGPALCDAREKKFIPKQSPRFFRCILIYSGMARQNKQNNVFHRRETEALIYIPI